MAIYDQITDFPFDAHEKKISVTQEGWGATSIG